MTRRYRAWLLPLVFLAGYLVAWGTIQVDRHMIIEEQQALKQQLEQVKVELKLRELVEDFGDGWQEMIIWNEATELPAPKEAPDG